MISVVLFYLTFIVTGIMSFRGGAIYLFVMYQGYYFFNPNTKWWGASIPDLRFSFYIVLTMLIVVAFNWRNYSSNKILKIPQFTYMFICVFLYALASFYATWPSNHALAFDALLTVAIVIIVVYKFIQTEKHLDIAIGAYMIFSGYLGYYITQFGRMASGRFTGGGMVDAPDANGLSAAIAPSLLFCLYYFWMHPNWKIKGACVVLGALITNGIVLAGSRGAFLGVAAGAGIFVMYMFRSKIKSKYQKRSASFVVVMGLVGLILVTDAYFWQRIASIKTQSVQESAEKETGKTRVFFWLAAMDMAKDYPFGAGAGGFVAHSPQYIPETIHTGSTRNRAVHSTWFEVLTEIGYPGVIAFSGMIAYSLITLRRAQRKMAKIGDHRRYFKVIAVLSAFVCFCVIMTFINRFRGEILYWLILFSAAIYNLYVLKIDSWYQPNDDGLKKAK